MTEEQEGYSITQGPDGRIVDATLSSERAREIGSIAKGAGQRQKEADELAKIVLATLPDLEDPGRQRVRDTLLRHYCAHAVSQRGQTALTAIEGIARMIGEAFAAKPVTAPPRPGELCSLCRRPDPADNLPITQEGRAFLEDLLLRSAPLLLNQKETHVKNAVGIQSVRR